MDPSLLIGQGSHHQGDETVAEKNGCIEEKTGR